MTIMIHNRFAALLADRLIKISKISADTGISRTTLTHLYYRRSKQISFDVLDALCRHLDCGIGEIIEYRPDPQGDGGKGEAHGKDN